MNYALHCATALDVATAQYIIATRSELSICWLRQLTFRVGPYNTPYKEVARTHANFDLARHCKDPLLQLLDAWQLLKQVTSADIKGRVPELLSVEGFRQRLQEAVRAAVAHPAPEEGWDPQTQPPQILLGVLASDSRVATRALRDWTNMLGTPFITPQSRDENALSIASMQGPVYLKYNAATKLCYATRYNGRDRGVLLTLGQSLVGHLPLGLFDGAPNTSNAS